ncbi:hypothetical protein [Acinetobacter gyllenbergii]|uniref:hypothetical protein n=1 Tax=Acinetobacter gyllenbergii TaxID=134534 RepID=UPI003F54AA11
MKNWKCKKCGLYIKVDKAQIKVGDKVVFYKIEIENRHKKIELVQGVVLSKSQKSYKILHDRKFFFVEADDLYPANAPAFFIYNLFGECKC